MLLLVRHPITSLIIIFTSSPTCLLVQTQLHSILWPWKTDYFLSIGHQQSRHFFLLAVVIAGDCAMTLAFHVLRKICRIKKTSLQFISTFGRNGTLSLEYLGPVAIFQQNINLREAAQTSSANITHSTWMHESDARHTLKCDIYEFNRVKNRFYRYTTFQ